MPLHCLLLQHGRCHYGYSDPSLSPPSQGQPAWAVEKSWYGTWAQGAADIDLSLSDNWAIAWDEASESDFVNLQSGLGPNVCLRHCSANDALLSGALAGGLGLLLAPDHWIPLAGGCHSSQESCPPEGGQLLGLARIEGHRSIHLVQAEGSLDWIGRRFEEILKSGQSPVSKMRFERVLARLPGQFRPTHQMSLTSPSIYRQKAHRNWEALMILADHPGPEPASLALAQKVARIWTDFLRSLHSRTRLGDDCPVVWTWGSLNGPVFAALEKELSKYLRLDWQAPRYGPLEGLALLFAGEQKAAQRRVLIGQPSGLANSVAEFSQDAWRQCRRVSDKANPWLELLW